MNERISIGTVAVLGAGVMGSGIARVMAPLAGSLRVFDERHVVVGGLVAELGGRAQASPTLEEAVRDADLVFEVVAEDLAVKHDVLGRASAANPSAIIASNTSSILPSRMIEAVENPHRFVIAHFFNPAEIVPLVEIVPAGETDAATLERMREVMVAAGKQPVVLAREAQGFVANRLQAALLREALSIVSSGVATASDVDQVVRAGLGSRWAAAGPFMISDLGGLDIWRNVCANVFPTLDTAGVPPADIVERVDRGDLGAKTGTGFYRHDPGGDDRVRAQIARHFDLEFPVTDDPPGGGPGAVGEPVGSAPHGGAAVGSVPSREEVSCCGNDVAE